MPRNRLLVAAILVLAACAGAHRTPRHGRGQDGVCHACFWDYQPASLRAELIDVYRGKRYDDPLIDAQRRMLLAVVGDDRAGVCEARAALSSIERVGDLSDPARALFLAEALAFTAEPCRADAAGAFHRASERAHDAGASFKAGVYADLAGGRFTPRFGDATIEKQIAVPSNVRSFVLGASRIEVRAGERVGVQVERTVRDWLSYQLNWDATARPVEGFQLVDWHEGACARRLLRATAASIIPLTGTIAVRHAGRWLAPDADGVFRFEVLDDKIQYPTTLTYGGVALIVDTHGISALVEPALRANASMVLGCGDTEDKMKAAVALARSGVDVWFPCDRFVGDVLGYDAKGALIGTAPVREDGGHAVIGDRPIRFEASERFIVQDFEGRGPLRYYDAAARYFRALSKLVPLEIDYVPVDDAGQSSRLIARAESRSASVIALRVQSEADAAPVREWLSASPLHRAVLFHSAPYEAGYALFDAFPRQTTFGDPRPVFE